MEITLNLPENIYQNVSIVARKSKRPVADLIADVVEEKYASERSNRRLANLADEEVLALANLQTPKKQPNRQRELLFKNQAGSLISQEKKELDFFQQIYGVALSQKADGVDETIYRKLVKSPAESDNG